jgi:hypothetical protein
MADIWNENLRCPTCQATGIVNLSQVPGDDTPTVRSISDSFKVAQTEYGPNFHCATCDNAGGA